MMQNPSQSSCAFATEAWFAEAIRSSARLPPTPGADITMQYRLTEAPGGELRFFERIVSGRISEARLGDAPDADVTFTMPYSDFRRLIVELISSHQLPQVRVSGRTDLIAPLIAIRESPLYTEHKIHMREVTAWP